MVPHLRQWTGLGGDSNANPAFFPPRNRPKSVQRVGNHRALVCGRTPMRISAAVYIVSLLSIRVALQGADSISEPANASPEPTFRLNSELVIVPVTVTDRAGKSVQDLRSINFSVTDPRRSPKTGQWWSPENRPMRKRSGRYSDVGNTLRQSEQCLERRKEEASHRTRPTRLDATWDGRGHGRPPGDCSRIFKGRGYSRAPAGRLGPA